jgi:hypothetical protein
MLSRIRVTALALGCLAVLAAPLSAQDVLPSDGGDAARFHLGPLGLTPSVAVTNVGVDSNVFNEADNPKSDTTAAIGPATDLWLGIGPSRMKATVGAQYLWFDQYDNERGWNTTNTGRWEIPLSRFTPYLQGSYIDTKDRSGYEIDSRARRKDTTFGFGTAFLFSPKTSVDVGVQQLHSQYDADQTYLGVGLAEPLNRRSNSESVNLRFKLTPLTTFVVKNQAVQDRFDLDTIRNANSYSVMSGFELRPQALISGEAFAGVRHFTTVSGALPDYTGLIASVKVQSIVRATRIAVHVKRDLTYSYLEDNPYYMLTDVGFDVTQRVTSSFDVVARSSWQTLAYQGLTGLTALPGSTDRVRSVGGGPGYRVGRSLRIGFDVSYYQRESQLSASQSYQGLRAGASITYGLPQ